MTVLERHIYNSIKDSIPELLEEVRKLEVQRSEIMIPFICDGVLDKLIFNVQHDRFTKIEYSKGTGEGMIIEGMPKNTAYYDEVRNHQFDIPI